YQRVRKVAALSGISSTVAGGGVQGNGDGGQAGAATIGRPFGVAVDSAGNVYMSTVDDNRVRKVSATTGIITTVAGTGEYGYNGDNIPAATAKLAFPRGLAVDPAGNVYLADIANYRIRKIDAQTQVITT